MADHDITAEFEVQELLGEPPPETPTILARVTLGAKTDLGRVRENNEDKFDWLEPEDEATLAARGRLYAVADGMGGHAAGQIASEVALKTLIRTYYAGLSGEIPTALSEGIRAANALVWETGHRITGRSGMGTTITALALYEDRAIVGQVGDSRAYLIRGDSIEQITEDHSWVAEQVRANVLTEEEAELSPYRNVITRSIGAEPEVSPDLFETPLKAGDLFLLCSDGLSGVVKPDEMKEMAHSHSPTMAAWRLIELANERGGPDNITCLILRIDDLIRYDHSGDERVSDEHTAPEKEAGPVRLHASSPTPDISSTGDRTSPAEERPSSGQKNLSPEEKDSQRAKSWFGWKR
ncbi:MAG: Stp1/IreP family PP2C-type Ser/Thr phosphatase [Armatimonadetes bacterium]|nr:Stp1/IreP family PP2C-type Ser/Thr phosphatase [Armatimonadota bacterium]